MLLAAVLAGVLGLSLTEASAPPASPPACCATGQDCRWSIVTVLPGEELSGLAERFNVTVAELSGWNHLKEAGAVIEGTRLRVFSTVREVERFKTRVRIREATTWARLAARYEMPQAALLRGNRRRRGGAIAPGEVVVVYLKKHRWNRTYLDGAVQLQNGPGVIVKHPEWAWGRPVAVRTLEAVGRELEQRDESATLVVGDLSLPRGGRFPPHKGHKAGLDADIGLMALEPARDLRFRNLKPEEMDVRRQWMVLRLFLESGRVERVLIDWSLQRPLYEAAVADGVAPELLETWFQYPARRGEPKGVVRHYRGHRHHLHIRFIEPEGEAIL